MKLLLIDIGGTTVKTGYMNGDQFEFSDSFTTPKTWAQMKNALIKHTVKYTDYEGVGIAIPGAVDSDTGIIHGISALPYIHEFNIRREFEKLFHVPVVIQNDANCAALAEVWKGNTRGVRNAAFLIIGTGVGGAVIEDSKLWKGAHLFAGEFGMTLYSEHHTLGEYASPVTLGHSYTKRLSDGIEYSGKDVFDKALSGERIAGEMVEKFDNALSDAVFNIGVTFDPEVILIGGGLSRRKGMVEVLNNKIHSTIGDNGLPGFNVNIGLCKYLDHANIIGAAYSYIQQLGK